MKYLIYLLVFSFSLLSTSQASQKFKWDADNWQQRQQKTNINLIRCEKLINDSFKNFENDEQCKYTELQKSLQELYEELIKGLYKYPPSEELKDVAIYEFTNPVTGLKSMQEIARDIDLLIYINNMIILNKEK